MSDQPLNYNKAYASGISGSLTLILVWLWDTFIPTHPIPAEVGVALSSLISTLAVVLTPHGSSQSPSP